MAEEAARSIWADGGIVAGTARPIGKARPVETPEPGFRVSGRWPFASGSSHATWFAAECTVYDGDTPRQDAQGDAVTRMLFVPRADVTLHDTWFTTGLRGTASNDFSVDDAFVPTARGFQMIVDPPRHTWPVYRALPLVFMNHGSQALGVGRGAIDVGREILSTRMGWGGQPLRAQPRLQTVMAEAVAAVQSARCFLYHSADHLWRLVSGSAPDEQALAQARARVRLAASHAAQASVYAVDLLHAAIGTAGIFSDSPLERRFRDIHTAAAHVMIGPLTYEAAGRVELGLDPAFPFF